MPYALLARLVDYPGPDLARTLGECIAAVTPESSEAAALLEQFRDLLLALDCARMEEHYTRTFDLQAETSLYIGHQLFGEDWRRSLFMARLQHRYREIGFACGSEMPDHLAAILRFVAAAGPDPEAAELIPECVVPALSRLLRAMDGKDSPYQPALRAMLVLFRSRDNGTYPSEDFLCRPSSLSLFPILP